MSFEIEYKFFDSLFSFRPKIILKMSIKKSNVSMTKRDNNIRVVHSEKLFGTFLIVLEQ